MQVWLVTTFVEFWAWPVCPLPCSGHHTVYCPQCRRVLCVASRFRRCQLPGWPTAFQDPGCASMHAQPEAAEQLKRTVACFRGVRSSQVALPFARLTLAC
eukprot:15448931-Alexandrium_andersonii.AAC.1